MKRKAYISPGLLPSVLLGLGSIVGIWIGFSLIALHPQHQLMDAGVDGFRTYFTILYYLQHGQGWEFNGMNYPYPEFLIYTDNLSFLSFLINSLSQIISITPETGLALIHSVILLSFFITPFLIFRILRQFELPATFSVLAALPIGFLSPQLQRLEGHLGLTFNCFIPLLWYGLIQLEKRPIWIFFLPLFILLFSLIHPYYLPLGTLFTGLYLGWKKKWSQCITISLIPVGLFKAFTLIFDQISDRPLHPYGFFAYQSYWEGIFLPHEGPLWDFINLWVDVRDVNMESYGYVGFTCFCVAIGSLLFSIRHITSLSKWKHIVPSSIGIYVGVGCIALLISMALPFQLGLKWVPEYVPVLKQFRSLGRFSWIFYYTFSVFSAIIIYKLFTHFLQNHRYWLAYVFLFLTMGFWWWETYIHLQLRHLHIKQQGQNMFVLQTPSYEEILVQAGYQPEEFQAILPIPYFHIGSEKFAPSRVDFHAFRQSLIAAYQTGIPLATRIMPRASLSQSLQQVQLISHPLVSRRAGPHLPFQTPFLCIVNQNVPLTPEETRLLSLADSIANFSPVTLYSLSLDQLEAFRKKYVSFLPTNDEIMKGFRPMDKVIGHHLTDTVKTYWHKQSYYYTTDTTRYIIPDLSTYTFTPLGMRAISDSAQFISLYHTSHPPFPPQAILEASVWVKADLRRDVFPIFYVEGIDEKGSSIFAFPVDPKYSTEVFQDWVRVSKRFSLPENCKQLHCYMKGRQATVDQFMLRDTSTHILVPVIQDSLWMQDNYFIKMLP